MGENETIGSLKLSLGAGAIRSSTVGRSLEQELEAAKQGDADKATYKIEVLFSRRRSSLLHKPSPVMILIWESGKRLHGGGDEKMYWCGYPDCERPIKSDDFGYMHVVCRHCNREQFLDPDGKRLHIKQMERENKTGSELKKMPIVIGERLANLTPGKLADYLVRQWHLLEMSADLYLKYSPDEIRYHVKHETNRDIDNLDKVRMGRRLSIYTLKAIRQDLAAGSDLRTRFLAMLTA